MLFMILGIIPKVCTCQPSALPLSRIPALLLLFLYPRKALELQAYTRLCSIILMYLLLSQYKNTTKFKLYPYTAEGSLPQLSRKNAQRTPKRGQTDGSGVKSTSCSCRTCAWQLTAASSRGSDALFRPLLAMYAHAQANTNT